LNLSSDQPKATPVLTGFYSEFPMKFGDNYSGRPSELLDVPMVDCVAFKVQHIDKPQSSPVWSPFRHWQPARLMPYPNIQNQEVDARGSIWDIGVTRALENDVSNVWAEFGVLYGISARYFQSRLPDDGRLLLYDSFEGIPEDWGPHKAGHFAVDRVPTFDDDRVEVMKGWFRDTLPLNEPVGLVNIDCDLYSSTKEVLNGISVIPGTVILFDELFGYDGWEDNEYKALMEWDVPYKFIARDGRYAAAIEVL
jgi:hypothetical protein